VRTRKSQGGGEVLSSQKKRPAEEYSKRENLGEIPENCVRKVSGWSAKNTKEGMSTIPAPLKGGRQVKGGLAPRNRAPRFLGKRGWKIEKSLESGPIKKRQRGPTVGEDGYTPVGQGRPEKIQKGKRCSSRFTVEKKSKEISGPYEP